MGWAAAGAAVLYDSVTRLLERSGPAIRLGAAQFTSIVTAEEIRATRERPSPATQRSGEGRVPIRIAWAGRMVADKGLDDLLPAISSLRAHGIGATLELLGDGPARPDTEAAAARLGVAELVDWRGHVADRAEYMDRLREADVFVLPSRAEGIPKVVIEAMAAGLPVVATSVGGLPELVRGGAPAMLVAPGDPGGLAAALEGLARDEEQRTRLREAGLTYAAEHTIDAQAAALVSWLRATFPALPWAPEGAAA